MLPEPAMNGNPATAGPSKTHVGPRNPDDAELVTRLRAGDATAYEEAMVRYGDRLYAMLLHLVNGDHEQAGELTQEAFVRAYANLDRFAGHSSFYTWLYRLARNRALDILARKRPLARDLETLGRAAPGISPLDQLAGAELRTAVRAALDTLPGDTREILLLREFDGLDYAQIAELLDCAEGTVKSRLSRARAALRAALDGTVVAEDLA